MANPDASEAPPAEAINALIGLLNAGRFGEAVAQAQALLQTWPGSFLLWNLLGAASAQNHQIDLAVTAFGRTCALNPDFAEAHANLGHALKMQRKLDAAIASYRRALALNPDSATANFDLGNGLVEQGQLDAAAACYRRVVALQPHFAQAHNTLGEVLSAQGKADEAAACYRAALACEPGFAEAHNNLAGVLAAQGQLDVAAASYRNALACNPDFAEAHYNFGIVLQAQGQTEAAIACYSRALAIEPRFAEACNNLGALLKERGNLDQAADVLRRALALKPDFAGAHDNLGTVMLAQGRLADAAACHARALAISPDFAGAHFNLGGVLRALGQLDQAVASYTRAVTLQPDFAEAHNNLGEVFRDQGLLAQAAACYARALAIKPGYAEAHHNLGNVRKDQGKLDEAIAAYARALALKPDFADAEAQLLHQVQAICDWRDHANLAATRARLAAHKAPLTPFVFLPMADDPATQLEFSRKWADRTYRQAPLPLPARPAGRPQRLRVGYFSADFHDHATLVLMAGLLRAHNTAQFEVFAYSYGRDAPGMLGEQARKDIEHFFDVAQQPSRAMADLARSHALDIAIDLKGYTANGRSEVFQYRLAPVQISYLGYPGSLGTGFIDYLIADSVVIPPDQRPYYSERVIFLPHSYQPNDNARAIAATAGSRADFGLPDAGFVFCCFNNSYKISPREFDIWMRLLGQVDGSVLWLLRSNQWCEANLRREAAARGIATDRLVFAERMDQASHLARHRHADLFLDTFLVNAHTTASDALWAGLPVVTRTGRQFAARVSASLLTAVGLPDLITRSDADYEALILALATDPARVAQLKARLAANRLSHPLFDTGRYTRHFEAGLAQAHALFAAGRPAQDIRVTANVGL